jgi:hypothetical protein
MAGWVLTSFLDMPEAKVPGYEMMSQGNFMAP